MLKIARITIVAAIAIGSFASAAQPRPYAQIAKGSTIKLHVYRLGQPKSTPKRTFAPVRQPRPAAPAKSMRATVYATRNGKRG